MDDSIYHGLARLDWGLGNPNKTAALIALMMIAVWLFGYIRKWGFWIALLFFTTLGFCLVVAQSRGGLLGLLVGCAFVLAWVPRPFPFNRSIAVIISCIALTLFALIINAGPRYVQGVATKDLSIENRLLIWKQVPSMIHDAPNGWGIGKSGDAYMQWYQPITRGEGYRTLVSSHFTWFAELNWWGRVLYVFAWAVFFIVLWPHRDYRWFSIPFATWLALGVCSTFSTVAESPFLWVIPALAIITVLSARFKMGIWPPAYLWFLGIFTAIFLITGIFILAMFQHPPLDIYCPREGVVIIGPHVPSIWIISPNKIILGEHYGHEVRRDFGTNPMFQETGLEVESELSDVPQDKILVFSGQIPTSCEALHPSQVILINPQPASLNALQSLAKLPKVIVILGEYSQNKSYWVEQAHSYTNIKVQLVAGSEEYIPHWMQEISAALKN